MDVFKQIQQIQKLQRRLDAMMSQWRRCIIAHPDLCIWTHSYPSTGARYIIKRGAAHGHFVIRLLWLGATVRW